MKLAELSGGVIINADASQLYADLRILSARPSLEDEARVPHHLFGVIDGATPCSAADWAGMAKQAIGEAHAAGRLPILVGGTGLYIRTLLEGIAPVPEIDPAVRAEVRALTVEQSHAALTAADPESAARLKPADSQRIARALEVVRSTGTPLGEWQRRTEGGISRQVTLHPMILLPPRDWLYARADARFAAMLDQGAVQEVGALVARNLDPALPVMRAIGVREIAAWQREEIDHSQMLTIAATATRQYAKRQYTWFSRQPPASWNRSNVKLDNTEILRLAIKLHKIALTH